MQNFSHIPYESSVAIESADSAEFIRVFLNPFYSHLCAAACKLCYGVLVPPDSCFNYFNASRRFCCVKRRTCLCPMRELDNPTLRRTGGANGSPSGRFTGSSIDERAAINLTSRFGRRTDQIESNYPIVSRIR